MAVKQVPFMGPGMDKNMLQDEILLLGRLKHPNVIRIMGATQDNAHFNIFMEWMPGGSVSSLLDKFGSFHENVIISYTRQVLTGLAYLHDNKILHRDLKGSNLLVDGTGRHLRISDFGAAGCLHSQATAEGEFEGQITGTIPFMAPEVIRGENYGRSSDIWSVGCVVIEMATACLPWTSHDTTGMNHYQLMYKIARTTEPPPFPINIVSNSTRNMAMKCLKIDPNQRPSARGLLTHTVFANNLSGNDVDVTPLSSPPSSPTGSISRPVLISRSRISLISGYDDTTWRSDSGLIGESADI
ncbi:Mitogen-activated protein kinase kinase kinase 1 [Chamberlinius hualienensis]